MTLSSGLAVIYNPKAPAMANFQLFIMAMHQPVGPNLLIDVGMFRSVVHNTIRYQCKPLFTIAPRVSFFAPSMCAPAQVSVQHVNLCLKPAEHARRGCPVLEYSRHSIARCRFHFKLGPVLG